MGWLLMLLFFILSIYLMLPLAYQLTKNFIGFSATKICGWICKRKGHNMCGEGYCVVCGHGLDDIIY